MPLMVMPSLPRKRLRSDLEDLGSIKLMEDMKLLEVRSVESQFKNCLAEVGCPHASQLLRAQASKMQIGQGRWSVRAACRQEHFATSHNWSAGLLHESLYNLALHGCWDKPNLKAGMETMIIWYIQEITGITMSYFLGTFWVYFWHVMYPSWHGRCAHLASMFGKETAHHQGWE